MTTNSGLDAIRRFDEDYIAFPPFNLAMQTVEDQVQLFRETGLAQHLIILGESGTGKSTLCRLITQKYPRFKSLDKDLVPAIVVAIPAVPTVVGVAEAVLCALGERYPAGKIDEKTRRIVKLCRESGTEIMLFDEAQHIQDRGQSYTHYMVGDWIKGLIDAISIPTVFLALPRFENILQINDQLRRRFSRRLYLALGQSSHSDIYEECFELFEELAAFLPLPLSYGSYTREDMAMRLYYASDGRVAYIKKLLTSALHRALKDQLSEIGPSVLEASFLSDIWWEGDGKLNPFNSEFVHRRLDRGGEPFERGWPGTSKKKNR